METEFDWLTKKRQDLVELNRGKWVVIDQMHDKVFADEELHKAIEEYEKEHPGEIPSAFKIPRKDEEFILL